ncbi:MAG: hypothetical protein Tsb0013_19860 [Phycisphaerales bacterium]
MVPLPESPFESQTPATRQRPSQPAGSPPAHTPTTPNEPASEPPRAEQPPMDHAGRRAVCPYCASELSSNLRCEVCRGMLDPLSRQASQNAMGPWAVLDPSRPGVPGCSFDTLAALIARGRVTSSSIVRGPTTRQFWMRADHAPGVAVLLGVCHACKATVSPQTHACPHCRADLHVAPTDRQHLGLSPVTALPGAVQTSEPAPARVPPETPSAVTRELRHLRRQSRALGVTVGAMGVLLILVGGVLVWRELSDRGVRLNLPAAGSTPTPASPAATTGGAPASTTPPVVSPSPSIANDPAPDPSPTTAGPDAAPILTPGEPIVPALVGLDAALTEWHPDLMEAARLDASLDLGEVERALALLERVLDEATRDLSDAEGRFPLLRAWIERVRERADRMYAESILGG